MAVDPALAPAEAQGGEASTWQRVLTLAWPVLVQQFLILAVGLSDRFLAGRFQPTDHIAYQSAQTNADYLYWVLSSFCVFVTVGSTALVARFVGAGDHEMAVRTTNQSIILAVLLGLVGTVLGIIGLPTLLSLFDVSGVSAELTVEYMRPMFVLLVFQVIEMAGIYCLAGAGDTRMGLYVLGGVAIINLPLAWLFYLGLGFGFAGIALGTALSNTLGGLVVLAVLFRGRAGLQLRPELLRPDWPLIGRLLRVSVPAGVDSMSVVAGHLWFWSIVTRLGDVANAAHGIALRWEGLGYMSGMAFGTSAMALVGQNLGAGRPDRAAHSGWVGFALGTGVMCVMGAVFYALAPLMFLLFCPNPEQRPIIDAGVPVLRLVAFAMPPLACCIIFTYALRGAGDTRAPVLITWTGFLLVRIPLAYYFTMKTVPLGPFGSVAGLDLGLLGAWWAMFADLVVRGVLFLLRFAGGKWQRVRV